MYIVYTLYPYCIHIRILLIFFFSNTTSIQKRTSWSLEETVLTFWYFPMYTLLFLGPPRSYSFSYKNMIFSNLPRDILSLTECACLVTKTL